MNKLTLLGIATQPKYDDNGWTGADIFANIEAEVGDGEQRGLHRVGINLYISPSLALAIKKFGYDENVENLLMRRVESGLNVCSRRWPGTEKDANIIYEVMRLKMRRFVMKAVDNIFYSWRAETGEITEYGEEMLDRTFNK